MAAIQTMSPRHKPVPDVRNVECGCSAMWLRQVCAGQSPPHTIERTSNRWILCLTASLDFRGTFNAILSTLQA